jgi:hypothetical protein
MSDMRFLDDELAERVRLKLVDLQGQRTDAAFAVLLGCTRPHWWNVKHGRRRASYALVKRAAQHFPILYAVVLNDLSAPAEAAS